MNEYYVIKSIENGLYFRGKGANRWGKHFNQASIYRIKGMAEHSIKDIAWHGERVEIVPIQIIENSCAVEVVRCKDCRYFDEPEKDVCWCYQNDREMQPLDFCSYGERKDNENRIH